METGKPTSGQGEGLGVVPGSQKMASPPPAPGIRHNLPQIPTMPHSSSRMAVSKASLKEYPAAVQPFANLVSMEELEGKKPETPSTSGKAKKDENQPPSGLPTPPSDVTSETSPKTAAQTSPHDTKGSPPTPIKLKIRRSIQQGHSQLTSSVQLGPEGAEETPTPTAPPADQGKKSKSHKRSASKSTPKRTKTKALLKGQRLKTLKSKIESQGADSAAEELIGGLGEAGIEGVTAERIEAEAGEDGQPPTWLVGDIVWSKVSGHPWWPCMVSYDPHLSIFIKKKSAFKGVNMYHVQYFGDEAERAWVAESSMLPFEGPEKLEEVCKDMLKKKKKDKRFIHKVTAARKPAWDIAVKSAQGALPMTRAERKQTFTFTYLPPTTKKTVKQSELELLPNGMLPPGKKKQVKRKKSMAGEGAEPPRKKQKRSRASDVSAHQGLAQFMVFCQKRRESVCKEHPDFSNEQVEEQLKEQWEKLDSEQRSKFIPMGSDVKNLGEILPTYGSLADGVKRSPRRHKPTKKMIESQEQEDEESEEDVTKKKKKIRRSSVRKLAADSTTIDEILENVAAGGGEPLMSADEAMDTDDSESKKRLRIRKSVTSETESIASATEEEYAPKSGEIAVIPKKRRTTMMNPEGCFTGENAEDLEINRLSAAGPSKKEQICQICEKPGDVISCEGVCCGTFHTDCLGLTAKPTGTFKCDECISGVHTCFVCKRSDKDTKKCSVSQCGKFYHEMCIIKFPNTRIESNGVHCPLHSCATCMAIAGDDKKHPRHSKATKGRLFKCVRCPTAYHTGDLCIAGGSEVVAGFNIICSRHFQRVKSQSHHTHINISWCFHCSRGGTLLCCESCPASFHAECLGIAFPEGSWFCKDCTRGKAPLYGDIVWCKVGSYRWWPGEICHPKNVPDNIREKPHQVGEFPIHFFGSHDFYWTHKARVFLFQDGDKGTKDSCPKGLAKTFERAIKEATAAYKLYVKAKDEMEQQEIEKIERKPPPYRHIKTNYPIGSVQIYKADISEIPCCECKPDSEAPCSSDTDCMNRMLMYECHPSVCPAGDKCQNQRFQRRQYPESIVIKTEKSGWGLRTMVDIKKGQFVNEYMGDLIDQEECKKRIKKAHDENVTNFYMLTLDGNRTIDAGPKGNLSRFMNHSCQPNCETQKWNVNGDVRVGLFAIKNIPAGSDLTFNYNLECIGNEKTVCQCGSPNCSGFLGVRPKSAAEMFPEKKSKKKKVPTATLR